MRIFVDLNSLNLIAVPGIIQPVTALSMKRSPSAALDVQFSRNGTVIELPGDATGIFEMKSINKYDSNPVVASESWSKSGTADNTVYTFSFSLINSALDTLFGVNDNADDDVPAVSLMAEIQWTFGGNVYKSPTITVRIDNDVVRDTDTMTPQPGHATEIYLPLITTLTGGSSTALDGIGITAYSPLTLFKVVISGRGLSAWRKELWSGGTATTNADLGIIVPLDYNASTMNYVLVRQLGF